MKEQLNIWWPYIAGYLFAIVISHFPITWVVDRMRECMGWRKGDKQGIWSEPWQPCILGCVERALYVASFQLGKPEFIGVWLALKVAGQWKPWGEDTEYGNRRIPGRSIYNIFLIGSALSIGYAVTGAKLIEWCLRREWILAIGVPVSLLLATLVLWYWISKILEKEIRRRITEYELIDKGFQKKYGMLLEDFERKEVVKQKGYSFEVESDYDDWDAAVDAIKTLKEDLKKL